MKKGKFIVIEGIDGSGKTTITKKIISFLYQNGIKKILSIREPGGTLLGENIRSLIKKQHITNKAEILMLYAARIELIEKIIKPALKKGVWIIGDRHDLSSQTYQVCKNKKLKNFIDIIKKYVLNNFIPDLTLYLDVTPEIGLKRILKRKKLDIFEKYPINFFVCVRKKYLQISSINKYIKVIDATKNINNVFASVKNILNKYIKNKK